MRLSAGNTVNGKYRVYGEGAIHHNGHPCGHGLNLDRHPLIIREDYDSYWHWLRSELASWCLHMDLRTRNWSRVFEIDDGVLPSTVWTRLSRWLGGAYGRVPRADAGLWPKDSVYGRGRQEEMEMLLARQFVRFERPLSPDDYNQIRAWWDGLDPKPVPVDGEALVGSPVPGVWRITE